MTQDLNERVRLERRVRTNDAGGGASVSWTAVATLWANVAPQASAEGQDAEARRILTRYLIVVRRRADVAAGMRIVWRDKALFVRGVEDAGPRARVVRVVADDGDPL